MPPQPMVLREVRLSADLLGHATELLGTAVKEAHRLVPDVDNYRYQQLATVILGELLNGQIAEGGLRVGDTAQKARMSKAGVPAHFGSSWRQFTDVLVRSICVNARRHALYEEFYSLPVAVRRDDNSLGTDRRPRVGNSLHLLIWAVASKDLHCPTLAQPLTTGTRDDRTSVRRDTKRISRHAQELKMTRLPATLAENVKSLLASGYPVSKDLQRERIGKGFSPYLIIGELPCGPPSKKHLESHATLLPGCDHAVVNAVYTHRRQGILYGGTPSAQRDDTENAFSIDSSFVRWAPDQWPQHELLNINRPFGVEYLWSAEHEVLARRAGTLTEFWRLVNLHEDLPAAAAIIERHAQHEWPANCMTRWATQANIGRLGAHHALTRQGYLDLLGAANAAAVAAERCRREQE